MRFCVYLTAYSGKKLPPKYVGSTSIAKIDRGYRGSVRSKKWSALWKDELEHNPELFSTEIISSHSTREEALVAELAYQKQHDVVRSEDWINRSFAQPQGYFGMNVSGQNNPNFGNGKAIKEWAEKNPEKLIARNRKAANTQWSDPAQRAKKCEAMRKKHTIKISTEEFGEMQRIKALKSREKRARRINHNGITYLGWPEFEEKTGISKYRFLRGKF